jgi:hypothetical protein
MKLRDSTEKAPILNERIPDLSSATHLAETWISAGFNISLVHRILDDENGSTAKREMMFQLGHFQFATELAYSRLHQQANEETAIAKGTASFRSLFERSADAHALLVSASGYWKALKDLLRLMPFPDLALLIDEVESAVKATVMARNHIEHITERIVSGRKRRAAVPEVSAESFQQAIGRFEFPSIIFGDESFNVAELSGTVLITGRRIASAMEIAFKSGIQQYFDAVLPVTDVNSS